MAETKIADFAGEAAAADAAVLNDVAPLKRTALLACMVHVARTRARDDLAEMFCKRMASITKRARTELDDIRTRQAEMSERLIAHYRDVLGLLDPRTSGAAEAAETLGLARGAVEDVGGFDAELADIEAVAAHHANNYMPLVARHWRRDRATMFAFVRTVELEATSADRSVLDAVEHASAHSHLTRDYIPDHVEGTVVDVSFASEQWQRLIRDRDHPGRLQRRHFEACVFTYLAGELRTGDIAVRGSQAYANWAAQLLAWEHCQALLGEFCAEAGLPTTASAFSEALRSLLVRHADAVDAGYPDNADLVIDEGSGVPSLKSHKNNLYKAFREVGRVIRTVTLLRFISEPDLREEITAATNKVEAYNGFSAWLMFGHDVIERNDPAEQEKIIKFNTLVANCVIFHTAVDMTTAIRQLAAEGWVITAADLAALSPYITERIKRFGEYAIAGLDVPPEAFDPRLELTGTAAAETAAVGQAATAGEAA